MNNSYGCLVCFHFLPLLPNVLTVGRPLLPEAPEPPYLYLSHELKSLWQLSRGIMKLSCAAHCMAPQGSLSPPKEKIAICTSLSISYSKHGRSRCQTVLGIPVFWVPRTQNTSVLGIPLQYDFSVLGIPRYPPPVPKSLVFWVSLKVL